MCDRNPENYDRAKTQKAIAGFRNNHPELMPSIVDNPREKFRALVHLGQPIPVLMPARKIPVVALPAGIHEPIQRAAKKLILAIYYRETERIAPPTHWLWSSWAFSSDMKAMQHLVEVAKMARFRTIGGRPNIAFGDQFAYRWDRSDPGDGDDLFMLVAQFGQGVVITALMVDDGAFTEMLAVGDSPEEWTTVGELAQST
jgi:hypothetical protein